MRYSDNNKPNKIVMLCCTNIGQPISSTINIYSRGNLLGEVIKDIRDRSYVDLSRQGKSVSFYNSLGCLRNGEIDIYTPDNTIKTHEKWHKTRYNAGFKRVYELGYSFIDESMAYAIEDYTHNLLSHSRNRLIASKDHLSFYAHAEKLSRNGGLRSKDIERMKTLISNYCFITGKENWAGFMSCVDNIGVYALCYHILEEYGVNEAQEIFLDAIWTIEESEDVRAGIDFLVQRLRSKEDFLPKKIVLPRERMVGTSKSSRLQINRNEAFRLGVWSTDEGIENIVEGTYRYLKAKIDYALGELECSVTQ